LTKKFVERESKLVKSLVSGEALSHHMEDQYYMAMGRACGFKAVVGEEITPMKGLLADQMEEVQSRISSNAE